jgi:putative membrane protein
MIRFFSFLYISPTVVLGMAAPSDHMANERTFLAWTRTGVALIGFGFVIAKFALFLELFKGVKSSGHSQIFGVLMIALGGVVISYGLLNYLLTESDLRKGKYKSRYIVNSAFALLILVISIVLALLII